MVKISDADRNSYGVRRIQMNPHLSEVYVPIICMLKYNTLYKLTGNYLEDVDLLNSCSYKIYKCYSTEIEGWRL